MIGFISPASGVWERVAEARKENLLNQCAISTYVECKWAPGGCQARRKWLHGSELLPPDTTSLS